MAAYQYNTAIVETGGETGTAKNTQYPGKDTNDGTFGTVASR
jgi:hypothetical protein